MRTENVAVGLRVSRLFFVLTDLASVGSMYQYSLDFFKDIFERTLRSTEEAGLEKAKGSEKRAYWIAEFTKRLFANVSRSLFQRHTLLFSFLPFSRCGLKKSRWYSNHSKLSSSSSAAVVVAAPARPIPTSSVA